MRKFPSCARLLAVIAGALTLMRAPSASAVELRRDLPVPDGEVEALATKGDTLYLGGNFSHLAMPTGGAALLGDPLAAVDHAFPVVDGTVLAVLPDGSGGWFLGGSFVAVGGVARSGLAHVLADRSVDPAWDPHPDAVVTALALDGARLLVGGAFTTIGGAPRHSLAALQVANGAATAWAPEADGSVLSIAVGGAAVYVGGSFTHVGGAARSRIAALDPGTGVATAWNPAASNTVTGLRWDGGTVWVCGDFTVIGGQFRNLLAALDAGTGSAKAWNANVNGTRVLALQRLGPRLYFGGDFQFVGGAARAFLAAVDTASAALAPWSPDATWRLPLSTDGGAILASGPGKVGWLDAATGTAIRQAGPFNDDVVTIGRSATETLAGGYFTTADTGWTRPRVAALSLASGQVLPFAVPGVNGRVRALAVIGERLYLGGAFTAIGGQPRYEFAAVDASSGALLSWTTPLGAYDEAMQLLPFGNTLFACGQIGWFENSQYRRYLGQIDGETGAMLPWYPFPDALVYEIALSHDTLYACGSFTTLGGYPRQGLAALDAHSGIALDWQAPDTGVPGYFFHVAPWRNELFVAGMFAKTTGGPYVRLAALDRTSGNYVPWAPQNAPNPYGTQYGGLLAADGALFSASQNSCTAFDPVSGGALWPWDARPHGVSTATSGFEWANAIARWSNQVCFAGLFPYFHDAPQSNFAVVIVDMNTPTLVELFRAFPTPEGVRVEWRLAGGVAERSHTVERAPAASGDWTALAGAVETRDATYSMLDPVATGRWWYRLTIVTRDGDVLRQAPLLVDLGAPLTAFALAAPAPNPASGPVTIAYTVPERANLRIGLLDVQGREVARLFDGAREPGRYGALLDAHDLAPGLYFLRLQAPGVDLRRRLALVR